MLNNVRPDVVGILEDNFNYLTKMCTVGTRDAMLGMIASARAAGCRVAVNGSDAADRPAMYLEAGAHAVLTRRWAGSRASPRSPRRGARPPPPTSPRFQDSLFPTAFRVCEAPRTIAASRTWTSCRCRRGTLLTWSATGASGQNAHGRFSWNMVTSARLSVPLQLVREAHLRAPVLAALSRVRRRGDALAQGAGAPRSHLVCRRHLRPHHAMDHALLRRSRRAQPRARRS